MKDRSLFVLTVAILTIQHITEANPVGEPVKTFHENDSSVTSVNTVAVTVNNGNKLRQDGDGDGADGDGLSEVGTQVGQIVNGVVSGNVGDIFSGTLPFIDDADTQKGIGTIFESLTKPLNTLWATSVQSGQKYFGIGTTVSPLGANSTAPAAQPIVATTEATDDDDDSESDAKL